MIEAMLYYKNSFFETVVQAVLELPESLRPTRFSRDERTGKNNANISDTKRFQKFLDEGLSGVYLYADSATYSFYTDGPNDFYLYIANLDGQDAGSLLHILSACGTNFAYASDDAERRHRNRLIKKASYGTDEAWVGRDWRRYIPGLYWKTVIPESLAQRHNVSLDKLKQAASRVVESAQGVWMLEFFDRSDQWLAYAERLDGICKNTPGFFSISQVKLAFENAKTLSETDVALRDWR